TKNANPDLDFNFPCFTTHPRSKNTYYDLTDSQISEYVNKFIEITKEVAADFKPDIIHAQHLWITPFAASKTGIPYVITVHGTDLMGYKKDERYHKFAREAAANAKKIITISRQVHREATEIFAEFKKKFVLNSNGFDDKIFRTKTVDKKELLQSFGIEKIPQKIVSFVGKFAHFKGVDILIKAARIVSDKIPDVAFLLAGDGELRSELEKMKKDLELNNLYFLGHQNQETVASIYNIADISVVPSRVEPFGLVAIEALACGTPVVATNAGGLPDFINEKVGNLVEMDNPQALANAIIFELENNTKKTKGKFAAEYAKKNYSWNKTLEKVIEIYKS
ncbi:MAG: glycosyltransferase family 4 protein, partial [Candidatus Cloacimonadota bacterium]